jgi:CheY-like chemotaxis protein
MKRVLIIDDDPGIIKVVQFRLVKMGYEVLTAVDGKEGLQKVMEKKPDLVLVDFSMPFLKGDDVCKHIKAEKTTRHIPVILMTGSVPQIQEKQLYEMGFDDMIIKPFEPEKFLEKVRKHIG